MEGFLSKANEQLLINIVSGEFIRDNPSADVSGIEPLVKSIMQEVADENETTLGDIIKANRLVVDRLFTDRSENTETSETASVTTLVQDTSLPSNVYSAYASYSQNEPTVSQSIITEPSGKKMVENEIYVTFSSSLRTVPNETFFKFGVRFGSIKGHANGISFLDTPKLVVGAYVDKLIMPVNANIFRELPNVGPLIEVRLRGSNITTRGHSSVDADLVLTTLSIRDHITVSRNAGMHADPVHGNDVRFLSYDSTSPQSWNLPSPVTVSHMEFEIAFPELALAGTTDYQDVDIGTIVTMNANTVVLHIDPDDNLSVSEKYNIDERVLLYADERKSGTILSTDDSASTVEIDVCLGDFQQNSLPIINTSRQYYVQMRLRVLEPAQQWTGT